MKKIYYLFLIILFFVSFDVYAESYDVDAKYDITYNVEVFRGMINNNTIQINVNNHILEFTSTLTNIDVVIIKTEDASNNYAKAFTNNEDNYYLVFFKDGKKITSGQINVKIINYDKTLNVYKNGGELVNKSSEYIELDQNDYFFNITNRDFVIADPKSYVQNLEDINLNENSIIEIYNHKNNIVTNANVLGTGFRIKVNNNGTINEYTVIVKGDVDSDSKMSVLDIVKINNHIVDASKKLDNIYSLAADYNKDGKINIQDIVKINNAIIGGN